MLGVRLRRCGAPQSSQNVFISLGLTYQLSAVIRDRRTRNDVILLITISALGAVNTSLISYTVNCDYSIVILNAYLYNIDYRLILYNINTLVCTVITTLVCTVINTLVCTVINTASLYSY